ncbi:MAG: DNA topoisomerase IV subunit A, partial [Proteobacteria bacterium]|nr:DNA topoisomerase IV subunit A [Pseudomonadota bacterium]
RQLAKLEQAKIQREQKDLVKEHANLEKILGSDTKLNNLVIKEIQADSKKYGNSRKTPVIKREQAQAFAATTFISSEPITVILSTNGWVRAAKGHDIDPNSLNYRAGDKFANAAYGRNNQQAVFFDTTGRSYSASVHTLPSARSSGEPLTGRFTPPTGAKFIYVLLGEESDSYLLASNAGYGFVVNRENLYTKNKAGKAILTLPKDSGILPPLLISNQENQYYIVITSVGYLSIVKVADLPKLSKGKGVKLLNIPAKNKDETVAILSLLDPKTTDKLVLYSGKRHLTLKNLDIESFIAERNRRGQKLPRGFQKIDRIEVSKIDNLTLL